MDIETALERVIFTLDQIEVKGRENWDKMLGCTNLLNECVAALKKAKEEESKSE